MSLHSKAMVEVGMGRGIVCGYVESCEANLGVRFKSEMI